MGTIGAATSAAKLNRRVGVKTHGNKLIVEKKKWVGMSELKRDVERGIQFYNSNHPHKMWIP